MDYQPYILAAVVMLTVSAGFFIGFKAVPNQQIALDWSVPSGPEVYPTLTR
jgi:hypothetical protein